MEKINFENKVTLVDRKDILQVNKMTAENVNEMKDKFNQAVDQYNDIDQWKANIENEIVDELLANQPFINEIAEKVSVAEPKYDLSFLPPNTSGDSFTQAKVGIDMDNNRMSNVADPVNTKDAVNLQSLNRKFEAPTIIEIEWNDRRVRFNGNIIIIQNIFSEWKNIGLISGLGDTENKNDIWGSTDFINDGVQTLYYYRSKKNNDSSYATAPYLILKSGNNLNFLILGNVDYKKSGKFVLKVKN